SDKSIVAYMDTVEAINKIRDPLYRADTAGTMQALVGLWQIFVRQRTLPDAQADTVFASIVTPFEEVRGNRDLFDAGRSGAKALLAATGGKAGTQPQERFVDLLAGPARAPHCGSPPPGGRGRGEDPAGPRPRRPHHPVS